jgi:hypothetical protein
VIDSSTGPLIVTSAINPPENMPSLRLADARLRLFQTYCSLICWIRETKIANIVLCDNSGTDHAFSELAILAEQHHKRLEVLVFRGDHGKTRSRGKGYGEGEIMKHAMKHSLFLREDTAFYKVTGRIFVEGFDALHDAHATKSVVFYLPPNIARLKKTLLSAADEYRAVSAGFRLLRKGNVMTTFYKCTKQYYMDNLLDRFRHVDDRRGHWLEHALMAPLLANGFDVFSMRPRLVGMTASRGILYDGVDYSDEVKSFATQLLSR